VIYVGPRLRIYFFSGSCRFSKVKDVDFLLLLREFLRK